MAKEREIGTVKYDDYEYKNSSGEEKAVAVYAGCSVSAEDRVPDRIFDRQAEYAGRNFMTAMGQLMGTAEAPTKVTPGSVSQVAEKRITPEGEGSRGVTVRLTVSIKTVDDMPDAEYRELASGAKQIAGEIADAYGEARKAAIASGKTGGRRQAEPEKEPAGKTQKNGPEKENPAGETRANSWIRPPETKDGETAERYRGRISEKWEDMARKSRKYEEMEKEVREKGETGGKAEEELRKQISDLEKRFRDCRAELAALKTQKEMFMTGLDGMEHAKNGGQDMKGKILEIVRRTVETGRRTTEAMQNADGISKKG